jgi:hypothetical protein
LLVSRFRFVQFPLTSFLSTKFGAFVASAFAAGGYLENELNSKFESYGPVIPA